MIGSSWCCFVNLFIFGHVSFLSLSLFLLIAIIVCIISSPKVFFLIRVNGTCPCGYL